MLFAHGPEPSRLFLQVFENVSKKQWAFDKFRGKSRLFLAASVRGQLLVPLLHRLLTVCRLRMTLGIRLLFREVLASISRKQWAFRRFEGKVAFSLLRTSVVTLLVRLLH